MKNFISIKKTKIPQDKKGFTLVELMVVVGIIAIISALSIFNSSKLNSSVLLSNTIYEVGLIIRDAQVAGLGAKVLSTTVEGNTVATTSNQGVYFNINNPEQIIFFADLNKSNTYTDVNEDSQIYNIENKRAGKILKICKIKNLSGDETDPCVPTNTLNIIFKRPNPEAYFYTESETTPLGYQGNVAINMGFDNGECRTIIIYKTGGVQIDKSFCPEIVN